MKKIRKQEYTAEFKEQAVKHAQAVGIVVAAKELGLVEQTLRNWVKASAAGKLTTPGSKAVTPEQMELSRLRAENARLKMHVDILKKATLDSTGRCNGSLESTCRRFVVQRLSRPRVQTHGDRVQICLAVDR